MLRMRPSAVKVALSTTGPLDFVQPGGFGVLRSLFVKNLRTARTILASFKYFPRQSRRQSYWGRRLHCRLCHGPHRHPSPSPTPVPLPVPMPAPVPGPLDGGPSTPFGRPIGPPLNFGSAFGVSIDRHRHRQTGCLDLRQFRIRHETICCVSEAIGKFPMLGKVPSLRPPPPPPPEGFGV